MALPIHEHLGKSTLLQLDVVDPPDALENAMAAAFGELQSARTGSLAAAVLQGMRGGLDSRVVVVRGLVYGVLRAESIEDASAFLVQMQAAVVSAAGPRGDEWMDVVELCKYFCYSRMRLLRPQPRAMLVWFIGRLMHMATPGVEALVIGMLRNLRAGCCDDEETLLQRDVLTLLSEHISWVLNSLPPPAVPFVAYSLLRVLAQDRLDSKVRGMAASIAIPLVDARLEQCAALGRDLVRALVDIAELPECAGIWARLLSPQSPPTDDGSLMDPALQDTGPSDPRASGVRRRDPARSLAHAHVALLLRGIATPRVLAMRILPAAEAEARFIACEAAEGREFAPLISIFVREHVPVDDPGAFVCDMIRFLLVLDTPIGASSANVASPLENQTSRGIAASPLAPSKDVSSESLTDITDSAVVQIESPDVHGTIGEAMCERESSGISHTNGTQDTSGVAEDNRRDLLYSNGHDTEANGKGLQTGDALDPALSSDGSGAPNAMYGFPESVHVALSHGRAETQVFADQAPESRIPVDSGAHVASPVKRQCVPQDGASCLIVALLRALSTGYDASRAKLALMLDAFVFTPDGERSLLAARRLAHVLHLLAADGRAAASVLEFAHVAPRLFFAPLGSEMARNLDAAILSGASSLGIPGADIVGALVASVSLARFGQQAAEDATADRRACIWSAEALPSNVSDAVRRRASTLNALLAAASVGISVDTFSSDERAFFGEHIPRVLADIAASGPLSEPEGIGAAIRAAHGLDLASDGVCGALRSIIVHQPRVRTLLLRGDAGVPAHLWALERAFGPQYQPLDEHQWRVWAAHAAAFARILSPSAARPLLNLVRSVPHPESLAGDSERLYDIVLKAVAFAAMDTV